MKRFEVYSVKLVRESAGTYNVMNSTIKSPDDAQTIIHEVVKIDDEAREVFGFLALDTKNKVIGVHPVFAGTLNESIVHPREVFKAAILNKAAGIILFHNHPSGDTEPSNADIDANRRMTDAGNILGIKVLDHIIMGDRRYLSFKERGLI